MLTVRLRTSSGLEPLKLEANSPVSSLQSLLATKTGISPDQQKVLAGFPPKEVRLPPNSTIKDALKSGDVLIVERVTGALPPPAPAPTAAPRPAVGPAQAPPRSAVAPMVQEAVVPDGGMVVRRKMADDNSCLFNAVSYVLLGGRSASPSQLRGIVADTINKDTDTYSSAFLGKAPAEYCKWILDLSHWGGAIELAIFASHFQTQLNAIDIKTLRVDKYGEGCGYPQAALLLYDGIHYDALALAPFDRAPEEVDETVFTPASRAPLDAALKLAQSLRAAGAYTDTASFALVCGQCGTKLTGETHALQHAKATGHTKFDQYRP